MPDTTWPVSGHPPPTTPTRKLWAPRCAVRTRWCLSRATVRWRRSWFTITTWSALPALAGLPTLSRWAAWTRTPARRSATRSATGTPKGCSPWAGAWSRSPGHRSTASSSPGSWPAPAPAARSGSPPPTAGYRWSPALTSRGAWPRSQSGPRAAATTSPALSVSTWLPPQLRRHARGAPRWSMSVSRPRSTGRRWLPPGRTRGGCTRTRRCSPRSGSNAGRQSVMSLEHAGPAAAAARRQPDRR